MSMATAQPRSKTAPTLQRRARAPSIDRQRHRDADGVEREHRREDGAARANADTVRAIFTPPYADAVLRIRGAPYGEANAHVRFRERGAGIPSDTASTGGVALMEHRPRTLRYLLDHSDEGLRRTRLGEERQGAGTLDSLAHPGQRMAGKDDDRDGGSAIIPLEASAHLQTVQNRHGQIENNDIGPLGRHNVDHLTAVGRFVDREAGAYQRRDIQGSLVGEIISYHDALHNANYEYVLSR